jgi:hypothetical protein
MAAMQGNAWLRVAPGRKAKSRYLSFPCFHIHLRFIVPSERKLDVPYPVTNTDSDCHNTNSDRTYHTA